MFGSTRQPAARLRGNHRFRLPRVFFASILTLLAGLVVNSPLGHEAVSYLRSPAQVDRDIIAAYMRAEVQLTHRTDVRYPIRLEPVNAGSLILNPLMATRETPFTLTGKKGAPDLVVGAAVEPGMFARLGVKPILGRNLAPSDARGRRPVVVMSERLWKRRFGGDRHVVGKTIRLSNVDYIVIGVMPANFWFPFRSDPVELWTPDRASRDLRDVIV